MPVHDLRFQLEDVVVGSQALIGGRNVDQRWIRASCTCGWRAGDDDLFTIEENVVACWWEHAEPARLHDQVLSQGTVVGEALLAAVREMLEQLRLAPSRPRSGRFAEAEFLLRTAYDLAGGR